MMVMMMLVIRMKMLLARSRATCTSLTAQLSSSKDDSGNRGSNTAQSQSLSIGGARRRLGHTGLHWHGLAVCKCKLQINNMNLHRTKPCPLYNLQISALAALPSFGLIFGDFLKGIGAETSAIAIITSTFFCAMSFAGLFSGSLFRRFGMRPVGLVGGILYFLGTGMQFFANSTLQLTLAFSLFQGTGFGLIVPTSYTSFNNYFVKNRVMWMSFAQTLIGLGSMVYPILMQKLLQWYGFRGCLLVLTAINANAVLGMLLMHPVEWHMRRVPVEAVEEAEAEQLQPVQPTVVVHVQPETPLNPIPELDFGPAAKVASVPVSNLGSRRVSHADDHTLRIISSRASSITSLGNWSGPMVVSDASPQMMHSLQASRRQSVISGASPCRSASPAGVANEDDDDDDAPGETRTCCGTIVDFLDLTLLKKPIYVNIVLGITFALYSDISFFTMQPSYLFELGYTKVSRINFNSSAMKVYSIKVSKVNIRKLT